MIKKQIKTKLFDVNSRFVDISTPTKACESFNKMLCDGDNFTPVESVTIDQVDGLATCVCIGHKLQKHEVVEFKGSDINAFNSQYRIVDIVNSDTFTFAYNETNHEVITGELSVRLPGGGWEKHIAAANKVYYVAANGHTVFIEFDINKITFLAVFGGAIYKTGAWTNDPTFKMLADDLSFKKITTSGEIFAVKEKKGNICGINVGAPMPHISNNSNATTSSGNLNATPSGLYSWREVSTFGQSIKFQIGIDIVLMPITIGVGSTILSNANYAPSEIEAYDLSGGVALTNNSVVSDGVNCYMVFKFGDQSGFFVKLSDWY